MVSSRQAWRRTTLQKGPGSFQQTTEPHSHSGDCGSDTSCDLKAAELCATQALPDRHTGSHHPTHEFLPLRSSSQQQPPWVCALGSSGRLGCSAIAGRVKLQEQPCVNSRATDGRDAFRSNAYAGCSGVSTETQVLRFVHAPDWQQDTCNSTHLQGVNSQMNLEEGREWPSRSNQVAVTMTGVLYTPAAACQAPYTRQSPHLASKTMPEQLADAVPAANMHAACRGPSDHEREHRRFSGCRIISGSTSSDRSRLAKPVHVPQAAPFPAHAGSSPLPKNIASAVSAASLLHAARACEPEAAPGIQMCCQQRQQEAGRQRLQACLDTSPSADMRTWQPPLPVPSPGPDQGFSAFLRERLQLPCPALVQAGTGAGSADLQQVEAHETPSGMFAWPSGDLMRISSADLGLPPSSSCADPAFSASLPDIPAPASLPTLSPFASQDLESAAPLFQPLDSHVGAHSHADPGSATGHAFSSSSCLLPGPEVQVVKSSMSPFACTSLTASLPTFQPHSERLASHAVQSSAPPGAGNPKGRRPPPPTALQAADHPSPHLPARYACQPEHAPGTPARGIRMPGRGRSSFAAPADVMPIFQGMAGRKSEDPALLRSADPSPASNQHACSPELPSSDEPQVRGALVQDPRDQYALDLSAPDSMALGPASEGADAHSPQGLAVPSPPIGGAASSVAQSNSDGASTTAPPSGQAHCIIPADSWDIADFPSLQGLAGLVAAPDAGLEGIGTSDQPGLKRRKVEALSSPESVAAPCRPIRRVSSAFQLALSGKRDAPAPLSAAAKARQQLRALEQINLVSEKESRQQRVARRRPLGKSISLPAQTSRTELLETERNVEKHIKEVHTLGPRAASLSTRGRAMQHAMEAIEAACAICTDPSFQARFTPHEEVCEVAMGLGLDARAVVNGILQRKLSMRLPISHGPLGCCDDPIVLLQADDAAYTTTESFMASAMMNAKPSAGPCPTSLGDESCTAPELAVQLSLLFLLRAHCKRSAMIQAQQSALSSLRAAGMWQSAVPATALEAARLSSSQRDELVALRESYIGSVCRALEQRQVLWQAVQANLLDISLEEGCPAAVSRMSAYEKALDLRKNMDEYHANYAGTMRDLLLRILTPTQVAIILGKSASASPAGQYQGLAVMGLHLLEMLALEADCESGATMLSGLEIPTSAAEARSPVAGCP